MPERLDDRGWLTPILERVREFDDRSRTVALIRISAWARDQHLGDKLSTVHMALAILLALPDGATHVSVEPRGDLV
ncbi:hypothetical protein [Rugosimonospora africana]|uniref:hypothetical protein n=1 Tax=Rugosimonospora africana TaxID=556532 RepID=UPI0019441EAF|nr:hypothetical protein [Rugosimonospora africana]